MKNRIKLAFVATVLSTIVFADTANAIAINQCVRLIRNPQVGRETIVNVCQKCIKAKIQRSRLGMASGPPTLREFNLQAGTRMALPFRGPGQTRILGEAPCPSAR